MMNQDQFNQFARQELYNWLNQPLPQLSQQPNYYNQIQSENIFLAQKINEEGLRLRDWLNLHINESNFYYTQKLSDAGFFLIIVMDNHFTQVIIDAYADLGLPLSSTLSSINKDFASHVLLMQEVSNKANVLSALVSRCMQQSNFYISGQFNERCRTFLKNLGTHIVAVNTLAFLDRTINVHKNIDLQKLDIQKLNSLLSKY